MQNNKFNTTENVLTEYLGIILAYLYRRQLKLNVNKTVITTFHLNNRLTITNLKLFSVVVMLNVTRLLNT